MTVREYLHGAINLLRATFRPTASVDVAESRYALCLQCPQRATFPREKCQVCNCFLPQKTLLIEQHCPLGLW